MHIFVLQIGVISLLSFFVEPRPQESVQSTTDTKQPAQTENCPPVLKICVCDSTTNALQITVSCSMVSSGDNFKKDMEALKGVRLENITLRGLSLWPWPNNIFEGINTEFLYIYDSLVPKLIGPDKESILKGLEDSLHYLELNNLNAKVLKWSRLKNMRSLRILKVIDTPITKLYKSVSSVATGNLSSITFQGNNMTKINKHALRHMSNVIEVLIERNQLTKVHRTMFPHPAEMLQIFSLESNHLTELPSDLFKDMPSLKFLSVKGNRLHTISADIFQPLFTKMELILISENPLHCDCKLQWILQTYEKFEGGTDVVTTTCNSPENLHNQNLTALSQDSLKC